MAKQRFKDEGTYLFQFMERVSVVCPKCEGHAVVVCKGYPGREREPARVVCEACGYNEEQDDTSWRGPVYGVAKARCPNCGRPIEKRLSGPAHLPQTQVACSHCGTQVVGPISWYPERQASAHDPFFGLRLWFVGAVKGNELWAYNRAHLAFMKELVSAEIRERGPNQNSSLSNRLPKWMLDRKNRTAVLKAIDRLEKLTAL